MCIVNMICNIVMAICAILGIIKFYFNLQIKKTIKINMKGLTTKEAIWNIFDYKKKLDNLLEKKIETLNKLRVDDVELFFTRNEDAKVFEEFTEGNTTLNVDAKNYFEFYNKLTKKGQKEMDKISILLENHTYEEFLKMI